MGELKSSWVTFWTAVGALGTCAAVFYGATSGSKHTELPPVTPPNPTVIVDAPVYEPPRESSDIGTVRFDDYIYDDTCSCHEVRSLPKGAKIRLICSLQGNEFTAYGRSSTTWYQVADGYVSDTVVSTSSQFNPRSCS